MKYSQAFGNFSAKNETFPAIPTDLGKFTVQVNRSTFSADEVVVDDVLPFHCGSF